MNYSDNSIAVSSSELDPNQFGTSIVAEIVLLSEILNTAIDAPDETLKRIQVLVCTSLRSDSSLKVLSQFLIHNDSW